MSNPTDALPAVLVLAAGRSRRFGADKRLAMLDDKPVIAHVLDSLLSAAIPPGAIHVCLPPQDTALIAFCAEHLAQHQGRHPDPGGLQLLDCPNAHAGMGHTIADAVAATSSASGWLICLADMPFVQPATFAALWSRASAHQLLAPVWQGQRGHPVFFAQRWRESLCQLRGDTGARPLLAQNQAHLALLSVDDPGITLDIDTPSDLNRPLIL